MAKIRKDTMKETEENLQFAGMVLCSCLTEEQYLETRKKWEENGGFKVMPWWKWCLENIEVTLKSE